MPPDFHRRLLLQPDRQDLLRQAIRGGELAESGLDFLDTLREEGLGDIIVEKVDPRTLQSTVKAYIEEHGDLSEGLEAIIRSYDYNDITRRKEKRK